MKKTTAALLIALMVFSVSSCSMIREKKPDTKETEEETEETEASETEATTSEETTTAETSAEETSESTTETTEETTVETSAAEAVEEKKESDFIDISFEYYSDRDIRYIDGEAYGAEYNLQTIFVTDDRYPQLSKLLSDENANTYNSYKIAMQTNFDDSETSADNEDYPFLYIADESESVNAIRADKNLLSITRSYSSYLGGAHGMYGVAAKNYDPDSAKLLTLDDFCTDKEQLRERIIAELSKKSDMLYDDFLNFLGDDMFDWESDIYSITYSGLTVYFDPYSVAPYASGLITVDIPYKGNEDILNEKYWTDLPSDYTKIFSEEYDNEGNWCYVLNDDSVDYKITADIDDYSYNKINISINGTTTTFDNFFAFSLCPYIVKSGSNTFLYVFTSVEDDYTVIEIYKVDGTNVTYQGEFSGYASVFIDPENLKLSMRTDALGTTSIVGVYKVGDDGMPLQTSEDYKFRATLPMTLIADLEGTVVVDGKATDEKFTAKAGTMITRYATDNKTYVDLKTDDGKIIRCDFTFEEYPPKLNDMELTEYFDESEILYAA